MITQSAFLAVGVLAGLLLLIMTAARFLQMGLWRGQPWRGEARSGQMLILRESIALDPHRRVHLVQCGQRQVVLLTGGEQDLVIGWMQEP
jgi:flagellar protein FliO/FliZ